MKKLPHYIQTPYGECEVTQGVYPDGSLLVRLVALDSDGDTVRGEEVADISINIPKHRALLQEFHFFFQRKPGFDGWRNLLLDCGVFKDTGGRINTDIEIWEWIGEI